MKYVSLLIGGQKVQAIAGASFERRNPIDGKVVTRCAAASAADADRAVESAAAAFERWSLTTPGERRSLLSKAAAILGGRREELVATVASETGASSQWASFDAASAIAMLQEAAAITTQVSGEVIPSDVPDRLSMALRQPAGVVLGIAPWNAAIVLAVRSIAVPLACGNTAILKGSEVCPATHSLVADVFAEAGFPAGVVNYLSTAPSDAAAVVERLIAHPRVRRVNFTGSTRVGRIIGRLCGEHLKPAVLELGGKAPLLVLADADLEAAAQAAIFGAFTNSGQICMSTERIIVDASVADSFVSLLADKARALPYGDPRHGPVTLGSVVDMATVDRCNALLKDALDHGARLVCGGVADTTLMQATIVDRVTPNMRIYHEESFGPVKSVVRVTGDEEALACANDTEFGLSAAVFSRDSARAFGIACRIQSGICHINAPTVHDEPQMPFGGVKASGIGRFGGRAGVAEFTDLRWVSMRVPVPSIAPQ